MTDFPDNLLEFPDNLLVGIPAQGPVARRLLLVVGSGLSLPGDGQPGVPGTATMIERVRDRIPSTHRARFDAMLAETTKNGLNAYQVAFEALGDPGVANDIIKDAVLDALISQDHRPKRNGGSYEDTSLAALMLEPRKWSIRPGIAAIARLYSLHPEVMAPYVLTTNFDPLLELALKSENVASTEVPIIDDWDPDLLQKMDKVAVLHLHGYWERQDSLHTRSSLMRKRPRLEHWLRNVLRQLRLIVVGYGGWNDILMKTLQDVVATADSRELQIHWTCYGARPMSPPVVQFMAAADQLPNAERVQFHENVDAHKWLPRFADALGLHREKAVLEARFRTTSHAATTQPPEETVHGALAAVSRAQRIVAMMNYRIASQTTGPQDVGYGWSQDLRINVFGAPSAVATAQALSVLEGLAAPPPLLAQLLARPWLDSCAVAGTGGWTIEVRKGQALPRITSLVVQTAARAQFSVSPRVLKLGIESLLNSQHEKGGWGYHDGCAPDVITTAHAVVALTAALGLARDVLGDLVSVRSAIVPIDEALRTALADASAFLIVRQATTGVERGRVHSAFDRALGEVPTVATADAEIPPVVRTAECALAFRAVTESASLSRDVRGSAAAALERAGAWLVHQSRSIGPMLPALFRETWKGDLDWSHAVTETLLRGLLAAHVSPSSSEVTALVGKIVGSRSAAGLWANPSWPDVPAMFATKEAVLALREYAFAMARLQPDFLLKGPRMAVVDASHYGVYRGGLFGVTVVESNHSQAESKIVRHDLPFKLPALDMMPAHDDANAILRTRLLVDIVARSTVESIRTYIERKGRHVDAAVTVLRGGLAFFAPLGDTFENVSFGLLSAKRNATAVDVSWLVEPRVSAPESAAEVTVLLTDTIANTGATLCAAVDHLTRTADNWEAVRGRRLSIVVACAFAHTEALGRIEAHRAVSAVHVAHEINARDERTQWLMGIGFDAGDLAMGASRRER